MADTVSTLATRNPLRYRGYVYDRETGLYYLQSRYYNPKIGRFINADAYASSGQGFLSKNTFAYCANNPVRFKDYSGTAYTPVGAGLQFEANIGCGTVGVEVICYWDVDECANGGVTIAVYVYGGVSIDVNDPFIGSILATITDNSQLLTSGNEGEIIALASLLGDGFSISVSGVLITGNEDFDNTESYNGSFTSIDGGWGKVKGSVAYSDNCVAYSLGGNIVGSSKIIPSWGISKTYYEQVCEITLFAPIHTTSRRVGGGRRSILESDFLRI